MKFSMTGHFNAGDCLIDVTVCESLTVTPTSSSTLSFDLEPDSVLPKQTSVSDGTRLDWWPVAGFMG
jgi:hypothetical protein